jgi:hypothetical protein
VVPNSKSRKSKHRGTESPITQALDRLAAILLRTGLDSPAAEQLLRRAFVRVAARKLTADGSASTQSQIASISGVSRREVRALLGKSGELENRIPRPTSKLAKLVDGWLSDPRFASRKGIPRALSIRGPKSEFGALVRKYGRDITKKTLRVHLLMLGLVKERQGKLLLVRDKPSDDRYAAASADLKFVASQLSSIDFELGRRQYSSRRIELSAYERKSAEAMRQIAISRLSTVLSSLQSMSDDSRRYNQGRSVRTHKLLVSTTIAVERGNSK